MQCLSTVAVVRRETGGWKWPAIQFAYMGASRVFGRVRREPARDALPGLNRRRFLRRRRTSSSSALSGPAWIRRGTEGGAVHPEILQGEAGLGAACGTLETRVVSGLEDGPAPIFGGSGLVSAFRSQGTSAGRDPGNNIGRITHCVDSTRHATPSPRVYPDAGRPPGRKGLVSVLPKIIQGGMGAGVSNWTLANAVSRLGAARRRVRHRARRHPLASPAGRRRGRAHAPGDRPRSRSRRWRAACSRSTSSRAGRPRAPPYRAIPMYARTGSARELIELCIVANFVEVFLAREGHDGPVGINYLEKIQLPVLPSIYGAMLAGVAAVLMGAGIPIRVPGHPRSLRSARGRGVSARDHRVGRGRRHRDAVLARRTGSRARRLR